MAKVWFNWHDFDIESDLTYIDGKTVIVYYWQDHKVILFFAGRVGRYRVVDEYGNFWNTAGWPNTVTLALRVLVGDWGRET